MTEIVSTITSMAIHRCDESPIYGEYATHITMADEAAGIYFEIAQDGNKVTATVEELRAILTAAETMIAQPGAREFAE